MTDLVACVRHVISDESMTGPVTAAAPLPGPSRAPGLAVRSRPRRAAPPPGAAAEPPEPPELTDAGAPITLSLTDEEAVFIRQHLVGVRRFGEMMKAIDGCLPRLDRDVGPIEVHPPPGAADAGIAGLGRRRAVSR